MGLGDVTLMAMIGAFLGWQVVPLTLFLGALLGLAHAVLRVFVIFRQWVTGKPTVGTAIPFGPYLSMAAFLLMAGWRWVWPGWAGPLYASYGEVAGLLWDVYGPGGR
jgi:leader peptidase (prepilin peptidase)/N-methyltransferase